MTNMEKNMLIMNKGLLWINTNNKKKLLMKVLMEVDKKGKKENNASQFHHYCFLAWTLINQMI
jgi:hypothetical protein